jgi:putative DNA primase/helicase
VGAGRQRQRDHLQALGLDRLDYGRARKEAAKTLGVTPTELDKIIKEAREVPEKESADWAVEPWDEAVDTADLLGSLVETFSRYVVLPTTRCAHAMALWALHAWAIDAAYLSPILMFVSPESSCGKSTALGLIHRTAPRTARASNISAAAIFRFIEAKSPTLVLDEAETYLTENEEIRGILNSGHSRDTAHVIRVVGDDYQPKEFSTWAAKAIASIGKLAVTLRNRAIIVQMKRRKPGEKVKKVRRKDGEEFETLRRKAARWAADHIEALKDAEPQLPLGLCDRDQDNWEPLAAIAELAGEPWPARARNAAVELTQHVLDDGSIRTRLLADIQKTFDVAETDSFASADLAARLAELATADEEAGPWGSFGKSGKPITQRQIAKLLSEFSVFPRDIRLPNEKNALKGYLREQFDDPFERYLLTPSAVLSATARQTGDVKDLEPRRSATPRFLVADENGPNTLKEKNCRAVADPTSPPEEEGVSRRICAQCGAPPDGREQFCAIGDETVWLHPECQRFYVKMGKTP